MTFDQFISTRQWHTNLEAANPNAFGSMAGYGYLGNEVYIDDTTSWSVEDHDAQPPQHRWYLCIANVEWESDDLVELERRLYEWAKAEGYTV